MARNPLKRAPRKGARALRRDLGAAAARGRSEERPRSPFGCGSAARKAMRAANAAEGVDAGSRKAVGRGRLPDEGAATRPPHPGVKEPCRPWGEGRRQPGWSQARNQPPCDEGGVRPRIEKCLQEDLHRILDKPP